MGFTNTVALAMLRAHAEVGLEKARAEVDEALTAAVRAKDRLERATLSLRVWTKCLEDACRLQAEYDAG